MRTRQLLFCMAMIPAATACAGSGDAARSEQPIDCSARGCFQDHFDRCVPAEYTTSEGGMMGARVRYEILESVEDRCRVSLVYEDNPNPAWVDRELRFTVAARGEFMDRVMEGMNACMNDADAGYECEGELLPVLRGAGAGGVAAVGAATPSAEASRARAEEAARARAALPERIAFVTAREYAMDRHSLFGVSPDGTAIEPIATAITGSANTPAWSPAGDLVAFGQYSEIVLVPLDGSDTTKIGLRYPAGCTGVREVDFSPDGGRLTFSAACSAIESGTGSRNQIFVADVEGRAVRAVPTFPRHYNYEPDWSPDGEHIVFATVNQLESGVEADLYVVRPDGADLRQVTGGEVDPAGAGKLDRHPAWSPDGSRIAFTSLRAGSRDIWVVDLASGELRQLTSGPLRDEYPTWSRDGSRIAFTRRGEELSSSTIWAVPAAGGEPTRLTDPGHWDRQPAWR